MPSEFFPDILNSLSLKMILEKYWPFFVVGLFAYIIVRLIYYYWNNNDNEKVENKENWNDLRSSKNGVYEEDNSNRQTSDEDEDDYDSILPALPKDLQHIPLNFKRYSEDESIERSFKFYELMNQRRTVRQFSSEPVPYEVIENVIKVAGTAPSGAHTEPWTYVVVESPEIKVKIREIVEEEEEINYRKRMGKQWTTDLKPFKTNWIKPYLTEAPYLILVFKQTYSFCEDGRKKYHYYNEQSVSIAAGFLLAAIHHAGLASLTSTPLNCGPAIRALLGRPISEKLVLLLPVGYPAPNCYVPDLKRKSLEDIMILI